MTTREKALAYHAGGRPGSLKVAPTKPAETGGDLSPAYSPEFAWLGEVVPQIVRDAHGHQLGKAKATPSNV